MGTMMMLGIGCGRPMHTRSNHLLIILNSASYETKPVVFAFTTKPFFMCKTGLQRQTFCVQKI